MTSGHGGKTEKAIKFISSVFNSFDSQKEDKPPKPPSKPSLPGPGPSTFTDYPSPGNNPFPSFGNLSIADNATPPAPPAAGGFVGGFHPSLPSGYSSRGSVPHASSEPSFAMPTPFQEYPQSLTMQMALRPPNDPLPPRPHSNPVPLGNPQSETLTISSGPKPHRPPHGKASSSPSTPTKSNKSGVASPSATPSKGGEQCSGQTKAGKRCARVVKTRPALRSFDSDDGESSTVEVFCHQHSKEIMLPSGYYSRKNGNWVEFSDYIKPYLQLETQLALRVEMEKTRSQSDVDGYIYTFEILEKDNTDTIKLKVGRAVNLVKRIDEWGKQCGSKEQVLRGFHPERKEDGKGVSLMKGRVEAGEKGPWCHRLERLIHLELADLTSTAVYLDRAWPEVTEPPAAEGKTNDSNNSIATVCPDCGSKHKEIFEFQRWTSGRNKGKEWDNIVKPVIERWGKFVELYV